MTDTVPALKIAAKAFDHARAAEAALGEVSIYSHTARDFDAARVSLTRCIELLGLISPEPVAEATVPPTSICGDHMAPRGDIMVVGKFPFEKEYQ